MKTSTAVVLFLVALFALKFFAGSAAIERPTGQRTSVAGTPDKVLGGYIGR